MKIITKLLLFVFLLIVFPALLWTTKVSHQRFREKFAKLKYQFNYLKEHSDIAKLKPSTGNVRKKQVELIEFANQFFEDIKELNIKPFLSGGNLIGAVRNNSFIPWDDDLDFDLMREDYDKLIKYAKEHFIVKVSDTSPRNEDFNYETSQFQKWVSEHPNEYILFISHRLIKILKGTSLSDMKEIDFFPYDFYDNSNYTFLQHKEFVKNLQKRIKKTQSSAEAIELIKRERLKNKSIVNHSDKIYFGIDNMNSYDHIERNNSFIPTEFILPLKRIKFEGFEYWAPNQPEIFLKFKYKNFTDWPDDLGYSGHERKLVNKNYCMSHYLAFRFIKDENINFYKGLAHKVFKPRNKKEITSVATVDELDKILKKKIDEFYVPKKTALLLSGGIDSAILASYLPKGTKVYTFHCVAEGAIDERKQAKKYCDAYGLDQEIIEMHWEDFEKLTPEILKENGVPFHSIEVQLLKAARYAKSQGIDRIIIGDGADYHFGGMDKLLSKDWMFDEFVTRYNSIEPELALKEPVDVRRIYETYRLPNNRIDFLGFMDNVMTQESYTSYMHAFEIAGVKYLDPYSFTKMALPLDLKRVRNGEPKYMIRELFAKKYPNIPIPTKIPMPRATTQWLKGYQVSRPEFIPNCTKNMTGDQKWLCWCLEQFLNMHEGDN